MCDKGATGRSRPVRQGTEHGRASRPWHPIRGFEGLLTHVLTRANGSPCRPIGHPAPAAVRQRCDATLPIRRCSRTSVRGRHGLLIVLQKATLPKRAQTGPRRTSFRDLRRDLACAQKTVKQFQADRLGDDRTRLGPRPCRHVQYANPATNGRGTCPIRTSAGMGTLPHG